MKLFTGNKNPPFALDVALEESLLSYSVRAIMQREFVGNPNSTHSNGGKYFDEKLITEWRGDFGVFGEPIYKRSIDLQTLRQHPEFADHASFMLYAPVGLMERYNTPEGFYTQTPNLYVATLSSKMDAQAYHASVLQTHPLGHILIPFKSSPIEEWSLGFNVFDPALIKASPSLDVVPAITLAMVREEVLPVVRFVGESTADALPGDEVIINFRLETPQGEPITDRDSDVYLEATAGYLVGRRIKTVGGQGSTIFRPDGMTSGEISKIKVGFKYFSGTDDLVVNVL
ncbi:MAG: hypothetical protein ACKO0Z_03095 [Betaproteobacteria bacterium]